MTPTDLLENRLAGGYCWTSLTKSDESTTWSQKEPSFAYDIFGDFGSILARIQILHGRPSSKIHFDEPGSSAGLLPEASDILARTTQMVQDAERRLQGVNDLPDDEIDALPWKGPKPICVEVIVKKVSKGTFQPISEDDILTF